MRADQPPADTGCESMRQAVAQLLPAAVYRRQRLPVGQFHEQTLDLLVDRGGHQGDVLIRGLLGRELRILGVAGERRRASAR